MITINTQQLAKILDATPDTQNIMLVGRHGIGKSQILCNYYRQKGLKVVTLFLGQMSDPGDLIGLPIRSEKSSKTEFLPPYWFPTDSEPIVLFLDELNRARPEVLQTIMDLTLNRRLAGRSLPRGSRIVSAVNDGDEYQLTDLDPALVSRFNIYQFRPTSDEWLLWASKNDIDSRVVDFIHDSPIWLDSNEGTTQQIDTGLEKTPDPRAWQKVSDIIHNVAKIDDTYRTIIAGVVGVYAAIAFADFVSNNQLITAKDILTNFDNVKNIVENYKVHQIASINDSIFRYLESMPIVDKSTKTISSNLLKYVETIENLNSKEPIAHFASIYSQGLYPQAVSFIVSSASQVFSKLIDYVSNIK